MSIKEIISKIETTLISSFSVADACFDDQRFSDPEVMEHMALVNQQVLDSIHSNFGVGSRDTSIGAKHPLQENYSVTLPAFELLGEADSPLWTCPIRSTVVGIGPAQIRMSLRSQLYTALQELDRIALWDERACRLPVVLWSSRRFDVLQALYFMAFHMRQHVARLASVMGNAWSGDLIRERELNT